MKTFQSEDVDSVETEGLIKQTKQSLSRIQRKEFDQLPTVKRFFERVKEEDGKYTFQDVVLTCFEQSKESAKKIKESWLTLISDTIESRLENDSSPGNEFSSKILNMEGWQSSDTDDKFCVDAITKLYEFYRQPLEHTGFSGTLSELLEQWQNLCDYTVQYLSPDKTHYRVVWRKIFQSSKSDSWHLILLLVELLFSLPVLNAKVEQMFSLMKRIKTDRRSLLSRNILSALVQICMECPTCENFNAVPEITLWNNTVKSRRPSQSGSRTYKKRSKKKRPTMLMDESEIEIKDSESELDEKECEINSDE